MAKSITYSDNGAYLYYASEAINGEKTLGRMNNSDGTINNLNQAIVGGVMRGNDGDIYAPSKNGEILRVTNSDGEIPHYYLASPFADVTNVSIFVRTADRFNASTLFLGGKGIEKNDTTQQA